MTVSISQGNMKVGRIHSFSLHPELTCSPDMPCWDGCYARAMLWQPSVNEAWLRNYRIWKENPDFVFSSIEEDAFLQAYFRYFVGGDFPNYDFLVRMVESAHKIKNTQFWCFTKKFWLVNLYCKKNGGRSSIPSNLHIIFSEWEGYKIDNPYNFPVAMVINSEEECPEDTFLCGGNCEECVRNGVGCPNMEDGQKVAFVKHGHGCKHGKMHIDREEIMREYGEG